MAGTYGGIMQTRQPELFVALSITWSFATLTLVLRLLCRRLTKNRLWWDDSFAIIAYVSSLSRDSRGCF